MTASWILPTPEVYWSHMRPGQEVDSLGLSRATGVEPFTAQRFLDRMVREGKATKDGKWYGPKEEG